MTRSESQFFSDIVEQMRVHNRIHAIQVQAMLNKKINQKKAKT
ncbi:MAG: hypothetical protein V1847_01625 [Candidatus Diapherotrites archaeon]